MEDFKELFTMLIVPMILMAILSFGLLFLDPENTTKLSLATFAIWVVVYFGFWTFCVWLLSLV